MPINPPSNAIGENIENEITSEHIEYAESTEAGGESFTNTAPSSPPAYTAQSSFLRSEDGTQIIADKHNTDDSTTTTDRLDGDGDDGQDHEGAHAYLRRVQALYRVDADQSSWLAVCNYLFSLFGTGASDPSHNEPARTAHGDSESDLRSSIPYRWSIVELPEPAARTIREALGAHPDHQHSFIEFLEGMESDLERLDSYLESPAAESAWRF